MAEQLPRRFSFFWDGHPLPLHVGVEFPNGDRVVSGDYGTQIFTRDELEKNLVTPMTVCAWLDVPKAPPYVVKQLDTTKFESGPVIPQPVYAVVEVWNGAELRFEAPTPDGVIAMMERHKAYRDAKKASSDADVPHVATEEEMGYAFGTTPKL